MTKRISIAIIGSGFTGLTAAYRLSKLGHKVTIFEREKFIGGLASGFKIEGENLEKTYHHLFRTDKSIIALTEELGLSSILNWHKSSVAIFANKKIFPFISPLDLLKFSPVNLIDRIKTGILIFYLQKTKNWKKFENITAAEFMKKWSGASAYKIIWEPLLKGKFNIHFDKISMAWLWARLHVRANSRKFGESSEKLGYFDGGFEKVIQKLESEIKKNGGEILLESPVISIENVNNHVQIDTAKQKYEFDKVIVTTPSNVFARMIEDSNVNSDYLKKLKSVDYLGAVVMVFSSTQDIGEYYWHNINDLSMPFLVFLNHTKLIPKERYNNKSIYYVGTYVPNDSKLFDQSNESIEKEWFDGIKRIYKDFDSTIIENINIFKLKNAQHIVEKDYASKIPDYKTPIQNVFLSNFSQIYPYDRGTNYAVEEGERIAQAI